MITHKRTTDRDPDLFSWKSSVSVAPDDARIDAMLAYLRNRRGWVKRAEVFEAIGVGDRVGRALKAQCGGLVISDSQHGYKHLLNANPIEFARARSELVSRVRELQEYIVAMDRAYHQHR